MLAPPSSTPTVRIVATLHFIGSGLILVAGGLHQLFAETRERLG
jgi:hypothetical protein